MAANQRVIVYVDGFNFYFGLRKSPQWKKYYWIDVVKLFEKFLRPNQELVALKYFSARPIGDHDKSKRQDAYFQANMENEKFKLVLGQYIRKKIPCYNCGYVIKTYEEKASDVNIATQIVADAYQDKYDVAILVSADSDMTPAIDLARQAGKTVYIYFPPNHQSSNLRVKAFGHPLMLERYEARFRQSLMPDTITLSNGYVLQIPAKWKALQ